MYRVQAWKLPFLKANKIKNIADRRNYLFYERTLLSLMAPNILLALTQRISEPPFSCLSAILSFYYP